MNLKIIQSIGEKILYDGVEDQLHKSYNIILNNGVIISFSTIELIDFDVFEKTDNDNIISSILDNIKTIKRFSPTPDFVYYKNQQGICPSISLYENYVVVISIGEIQPARYQVRIEGVFEK